MIISSVAGFFFCSKNPPLQHCKIQEKPAICRISDGSALPPLLSHDAMFILRNTEKGRMMHDLQPFNLPVISILRKASDGLASTSWWSQIINRTKITKWLAPCQKKTSDWGCKQELFYISGVSAGRRVCLVNWKSGIPHH